MVGKDIMGEVYNLEVNVSSMNYLLDWTEGSGGCGTLTHSPLLPFAVFIFLYYLYYTVLTV